MISIGLKPLYTQNKNHSRYIIPSKINHNHERDWQGYQRKPNKSQTKKIKNIYGRKFQGLRNTGISTYKKEGKEDSGIFIAWNLKQALSYFDRRTTYLSLSDLKIWITHQSICIIVYPGWGSEGLRWRKHGEDERRSAEVAIAGKWEVGDNFGRNTFCLVLGKMTHYWLSHERRIVNLWYCIKQILKRSFRMPKFQYPTIYYFSILNLISKQKIWKHSQNWRN